MIGGTTARGKQAEDLAREKLERAGYMVEQCKPSVRVKWDASANNYVREPKHDFFGLVDLIAVHTDLILFVQVTHPSGTRERIQKIRKGVAAAALDSPFQSWEVWEWTGERFREDIIGSLATTVPDSPVEASS